VEGNKRIRGQDEERLKIKRARQSRAEEVLIRRYLEGISNLWGRSEERRARRNSHLKK
jgi:hypothetical protein